MVASSQRDHCDFGNECDNMAATLNDANTISNNNATMVGHRNSISNLEINVASDVAMIANIMI